MNNLSNTSRLKSMGILDIIAAIFLVIMGAMLLNVEVNAKYSASEAIIQALQFLIALGVILIPLGILLIVNASRRTAAARTAARTASAARAMSVRSDARAVTRSARKSMAWPHG